MMLKHILEIPLCMICFSLPYIVGLIFRMKSCSLTYLCGQILLWAAFQGTAVPAVYARADFNTLFWIYTCLTIGLAVLGMHVFASGRKEGHGGNRKKLQERIKGISPFLAISALVIAFQMGVYVFGMHLDEDDARWIAEANDALITNKMLLYNPATGEYIGRFVGEMIKDVFSPWSMYLAVLSRWTGIRAVVIAHTVYPPILLGLSYAAYYGIGCQLFKGRHEQGIFLLMVSVINTFFAGNAYTQSVFTLTRIWQGKAVVAAVMIPAFLFFFLKIQENRTMADWLLLLTAGTACCLFSGMGIAIGLLMIGAYGAFAVMRRIIFALKKKETGKRILADTGMWIASMLPSVAYGVGYFLLQG